MKILAIESSCDETAAAVFTDDGLLSNVVASQTIHEKYGGVVPELASRAHQRTIYGTVGQALSEAGLSPADIDAVAVTQGPGLMGALLVGICFAKGFSIAHRTKLIGVNHIDAHMYANFILEPPVYPFICLTVSGGHTQLVYVKEPLKHTVLGKTRDDAAGEAFDKIGKILGLPYPAGPVMDAKSRLGNPNFHTFPIALPNDPFDFSYSGLKTSVMYYLRDNAPAPEQSEEHNKWMSAQLNDICASVSHAITESLVLKLRNAVRSTGCKTILMAGGVSANSMLRAKAVELAKAEGAKLYVPPMQFCTDNAAMIAVTGYMQAEKGLFTDLTMKPYARINPK
ncbi:MAG: tRNA (adenosine(37)-N6)-threonylcarbamoyltransferase complex transferase subunit TsaD [Balneolales bacterium]|nr:tRNA (adenosine(37)-N6)-threonylcarbamoyltransferase complex transferase subunit TsaD [Balneolales bacterium]